VDATFNHQLWLAYSIAYCNSVLNQKLDSNVLCFFNNINNIITVKRDGRIRHAIFKKDVKGYLKRVKTLGQVLLSKKSTKYKEDGYHLFNMFAFARLKNLGYSNYFEDANWFSKALKYSNSKKLFISLTNNNEASDYYSLKPSVGLIFNRYGIPYNVSGFEYIYIHNVFDFNNLDLAKMYLINQKKCYESNDKFKFTEDEVNVYYRLYEYSYNLKLT
jgi:hypothetical protein